MRKRFPISTFLEFEDARNAKRKLQNENNPDPDNSEDTRKFHHYQIRKYRGGFRLVERLDSSEAQIVNTMRVSKKKRHVRL